MPAEPSRRARGREGGARRGDTLKPARAKAAQPGVESPAAPVVVGTAKQLAKALSKAKGLKVQSLVLDEVDRLLMLPGKYATVKEQERRAKHPRPALLLLQDAVARNPEIQVTFQRRGLSFLGATEARLG